MKVPGYPRAGQELLVGNHRLAATVLSEGQRDQAQASIPGVGVVTNYKAVMHQGAWTSWDMKPISRLNFRGVGSI